MSKHTTPWEGSIPLKAIYCERLGIQICFINTDSKSREAEAAANARLIAAAPRMYEVIKRGAMAGDAECLSIMAAIDGSDE